MLVALHLLSGPTGSDVIEAKPGDILEVGRSMQVGGLRLPPDRHMSARHFQLVCERERCRIRDLESTNGTFVNGVRVTETLVRDGDRIEAGTSTFVVRMYRNGEDDANDGSGVATMPPAPAPPAPQTPLVVVESQSAEPSTPVFTVPVFRVTTDVPFPIATLPWEDTQGATRLSIIVKATFTIGTRASVRQEQLRLFTTDVINVNQPQTVRFESDLVPFKPRSDVVLVGRAYAPGGKPVTQFIAGLRVGALRYGVVVVGNRTWQWLPIAPPTMSEPEPFTSMDLVYERAFGGIDGPGGMYCRENLVGTGFIGKRTRERVGGLKLPNIEDPRHVITAWDTRPKPAGFGFYGRGWMPRLAYAGTYDDKYMKERHPLPPADFSYRFFNGAHPDLQVDGYLRGDEEVVLVNVCPQNPEMRFRLPGLVPKITVARWTVPPEQWIEEHRGPDGSLPSALPLAEETVNPVLDTLVFVPDEGIFYEVFRGVCSLSSLDSLEVARITIGL
jgi:hypothetical protein